MSNTQKLLLLSCCAPCSCAVIERLHQDGRDFTVLFYNPNVIPQQEYIRRKDINKKLCDSLAVPFVDLDYNNDDWLHAIKGAEHTPERGERCKRCFALRLNKTAQYAKENGFSAISSVLAASRYKNWEDVAQISAQAAAEYSLEYDATNWRKNGLEERRRALVKELGIYDQQYCGCNFSQQALLNARAKKQER